MQLKTLAALGLLWACGDKGGDGQSPETDGSTDGSGEDGGGDGGGGTDCTVGWSAEGRSLDDADGQITNPEEFGNLTGSQALKDMDGDGLADLLVASGDVISSPDPGETAWILPGGPDLMGGGAADTLAIAAIGSADHRLGLDRAPSTTADIDGDGLAELILAAPDWEVEFPIEDSEEVDEVSRGRAWIFKADQLEGDVDVSSAWLTFDNDAESGGPYDHDGFGRDIVSLGDLDGDGLADIATGNSGWGQSGSNNEGAVLLWLGDDLAGGGTRVPADASGLVAGIQKGGTVGGTISVVGDVDGDGLPELLVGASGMNGSSGEITDAGGAYLISGATLFEPDADMGSALASFYGIREGDYFGDPVLGPGDVDGDGVPDLAIGAELCSCDVGEQDSAGAVFLWWGATVRDGGVYEQDSADSVIVGEGALNFAHEAGKAGDWDGDGQADLWVEAGFENDEVWWPAQVSLFSGATLSEGGEHLFYSPMTAVTGSETIRRTRRGSSEADLNGDGCRDAVVTAYPTYIDEDGEEDTYSSIFVFRGG